MTTFRKLSPEQEQFEKAAIQTIYGELERVKAAGYDNWQTMTTLVANLLIDFDDPMDILSRFSHTVEVKIKQIRQMRAN